MRAFSFYNITPFAENFWCGSDVPFVCTMTKKKADKKFDRKQHAKKLHLLNQGPNAGNSSMNANAAAITEKKLNKLQKGFGNIKRWQRC
jgi:hypothetical protein